MVPFATIVPMTIDELLSLAERAVSECCNGGSNSPSLQAIINDLSAAERQTFDHCVAFKAGVLPLNAFFEGLVTTGATHCCPKCGTQWKNPLGSMCGFCSDEYSKNAPQLIKVAA